MKTLEDMLKKAVNIIRTEQHACVVLIAKRQHVIDEINIGITDLKDCTYFASTNTIKSPNGSFIRFMSAEQFIPRNVCGNQWSHAFVDDYLDNDTMAYLKSRIRSSYEYKEPMGIYNKYYVERWEAWE